MSDLKQQIGLIDKFRVSRTDGTSRKGKKHHGCRYFVLDLDHDPHAEPGSSFDRVPVPESVMLATKREVVALCREQFPNEAIFKHDAAEIHPMSYAGRFLSEVGGPLNRVWFRLSCYRDGWLYQQPFYAINPDQWEPREAVSRG